MRNKSKGRFILGLITSVCLFEGLLRLIQKLRQSHFGCNVKELKKHFEIKQENAVGIKVGTLVFAYFLGRNSLSLSSFPPPPKKAMDFKLFNLGILCAKAGPICTAHQRAGLQLRWGEHGTLCSTACSSQCQQLRPLHSTSISKIIILRTCLHFIIKAA